MIYLILPGGIAGNYDFNGLGIATAIKKDDKFYFYPDRFSPDAGKQHPKLAEEMYTVTYVTLDDESLIFVVILSN